MTSEEQPAAPAPAPTSLANRYGGQKRAMGGSFGRAGSTGGTTDGRKRRRNLLIAALAVAVAFLAWVATSAATGSVSFKDIGYSTPDATLAQLDFQVTKNPDSTAACAVKALDSKFAVVGWKVVTIGPNDASAGTDGGHTTAQRVTLRTESQAVSAVVDNCWLPSANK
ncbi:DUF4307 domain-containing protein [Arthrobacter sp. BPSS-3]|uniref:DUF4307 domain-containing protein n=1 Tax=Arthrobacter sp. BPSS-3 TaxID=3366580 RepID=UPI0037DCB1C9